MNKGQGGKLAVALVMGSAIAVLVALQISRAGLIAGPLRWPRPISGRQ